MPGTHLNGELSSGENLADLGGLALAYDALNKHLQAHPKEDRKIDGLTPQQRCFAAWAQNWADKTQEGVLKQEALTDGHRRQLPHVRAGAERARLLRCVRHQARRQDVARPEGSRVDLVMAAGVMPGPCSNRTRQGVSRR